MVGCILLIDNHNSISTEENKEMIIVVKRIMEERKLNFKSIRNFLK